MTTPVPSRFDRFFRLSENQTTVRTEFLGGSVTFLAMAYIIVLQPAVLSGEMSETPPDLTLLDAGAVMTATCLAAALATAIMALLARYPIAQAPGMGENFFFVTVVMGASAAGFTEGWRVALGVVFVAGVLFLLITISGLRSLIVDAISPSLKHAMAAGIGLFIAFLGLKTSSLIRLDQVPILNPHFASPDLIVFFFGLLLTGVLHARKVRGAILFGIAASTALAAILKLTLDGSPESPLIAESMLMQRFALADKIVEAPPSLAPTFMKMDIAGALSLSMLPYIVVFLVMDLLDTIGTLVGVSERAGFMRDNRLPRAGRAMLSDALGTTAGACLGTSTVTSFIESAAGVEAGARTGLAGLATAFLFLVALFFSPVVAMVGSYPPITAPALVIVGAMMVRSTSRIEWSDAGEALPAFLVLLGIPATGSIADGLALGFVSYPILKWASGRARQVHPVMWGLACLLVLYYIFVRSELA